MVTILILIDGFLQYWNTDEKFLILQVTILILIDGFLQSCSEWETMGARIESQSLF